MILLSFRKITTGPARNDFKKLKKSTCKGTTLVL